MGPQDRVYKIIFPKKQRSSSDDSSGFIIAMVPLKLESLTDTIWSNPRPSSTKFCRPIKFEFIKESHFTTNEEYRKVQSKIDQLRPFRLIHKNVTAQITYQMELTLIDGKILNYISSNASQQTCNICGALPTEMNDLNKVRKKNCKADRYHFGLSTLRC